MTRAAIVLCVLVASMAPAQPRYGVVRDGDIVRLTDRTAGMSVSVLVPVSNAYEVIVNGHNILRTPFASVEEFRARPGLNGIPLMAPFANRLDEQAFYANGKKYNFDMELGNVRGAIPIHGYLMNATDWTNVEARADGTGAWVTNRLEFYRNPQYMQQFPFAHTLTMTYRLADGMLEVRTRIDNASREPMPVSIGYHPYFQLTDSVRDEWTLSVGAKTHWILAPNKIPTGETQPIARVLPDPASASLRGLFLDDGFSDFERDSQGRGVVSLKGKTQQLDVLLGPKYKVALVYTPPIDSRGSAALAPFDSRGSAALAQGKALPKDAGPSRGSVAIEPMAGITNAMNLAHKGLYRELQSVPPGGSWEASFWLRPKGFR